MFHIFLAALFMKSRYLLHTRISSESGLSLSSLASILLLCSGSPARPPSFSAFKQPRDSVLKHALLMVLWHGLLHTGVDLARDMLSMMGA